MQRETCGVCEYGKNMFINDKRVVCSAPLRTNGFIMKPENEENDECRVYKNNQKQLKEENDKDTIRRINFGGD